MKHLIEQMKALYGRGDVSAPTPDTKTPACKAGAQEDYKVNQLSIKNLISVKPVGGSVAGVIYAMLSRSEDGIVTIAPGIARRILDEANFSGQRRIQSLRQRRNERRILAGTWRPQLSRVCFAETPDGRLHLVDGQHRMAAIAELGRAVQTTIQIIPASDDADVSRLYAAFDEPGSSRSDGEFLDGLRAAGNLGLSRKVTQALFRAVALLRNDLEPMGPTDRSMEARERDGRAEEMPEWATEARAYSEILGLAPPLVQRVMMTQGVMATALHTLRHQPKRAREFWEGLADNDGLRKHDPRAVLLSDFNSRATNKGSIRQRVQRVAVAWNAFYDGRDIRSIRCVDGAPITIKGTPKGKAGAR